MDDGGASPFAGNALAPLSRCFAPSKPQARLPGDLIGMSSSPYTPNGPIAVIGSIPQLAAAGS